MVIAAAIAALSGIGAIARIRGEVPTLHTPRSGHTATLLRDGRVLIAGGTREGEALASTELFDAATSKSATSADLAFARGEHTATLLADGRVLVAGGRNGNVVLDSAEIYDPSTSSFGIAAKLTAPRSGHAAIALRNGDVLVTGGDAAGTAEIYESKTGAFHAIGAMSAPRSGHSMALLPDGRVLIAGGRNAGGAALDSAEIFDASAGTFTAVGSMKSARIQPILNALPDGKVQVVGGDSDGTFEIFDSKTGHFAGRAIASALGADTVSRTIARFSFLRADSNAVDNATSVAIAQLVGRASAAITAVPASHIAVVTGGTSARAASMANVTILGDTSAVWVTTDKNDYPPGETVTITGGGFDPGEKVSLYLERNPETSPNSTIETVADADGNISNSDYVCLDTDANVTFTLTATGQSSSKQAVTSFTDAPTPTVRKYSAALTTAASLAAGASTSVGIKFTADATNSGSNSTIAAVTIAVPSGWTAPTSVSAVASNSATWTSSISGNNISLSTGGTALPAGGTLTVTFTTASPCATGSATFATTAASGTNGGAQSFTNTASDPSISVTGGCSFSAVLSGPGGNNPDPAGATAVTYTMNLTPVSGLLGSATIAVPSGFANVSIKSVNPGNGKNWTGVVNGSTIKLTGNSAADALDASANGNPKVVLTYWADTPCPASQQNYTWTTTGYPSVTASGPTSTLTTAQPLSTVGSCVTATTLTAAAATGSYGGSVNVSATLAPAVSGKTVSFTIQGGATGSGTTNASGVATATISLGTVNAGTYATGVSASFAGDTQYAASSGSASLTVNAATSSVTVTCPSATQTYTGSALTPCTATYATSDNLSGSLTPSYSNNTNAGNASASASYAGDANHASSSNSASFTIGQASSTTTVTCPASVTYTGSALTPCTASVSGAGLSQTLTVSYANNTNAGSAGASASYAGDANHTSSSDSKSFGIDKASSTTAVSCPASVTYTGSALTPCTVSVTGANLSLTPAADYANNTNAGTATASYTFAGDANHNGSSDSKSFGIDKASSTTAVSCPASVTYTGSALTPCTVSVTGANLSLTPAANYANNTNAGSATASYTFGGDANHNGSSDSKSFGIDKASSSTSVTCPASVTYTGSALTPCTVSVTGASLSLTPAADYANNTNVGTATASYTFAGDANHDGSSDSKSFGIDKASSTTTVTCPASVTYTGAALTPCTVSVSGANLSLTPAADYANNTNVGNATASYTFAGDANHNGSSDSKSFGIDKASSTTTVTCPASVTYTGSALTPCTVSVSGANLSLTPAADYANNTNVGNATASYTFAGDANHNGSSDSKSFGISKASSITVVTCPASVTYNGSPLVPCSVSITGPNLSLTPPADYANNVNAGQATASYTFGGDANHNGSSDSKNFTINPASSTVAVSCPASVGFSGLAITPCSAVAHSVSMADVPLTVSYSNNLHASNTVQNPAPASASASWPGDANHASASSSATFVINKAPALLTLADPTPNPTQYSDTVTILGGISSPLAIPPSGAPSFAIVGASSRNVAPGPVTITEFPGSYNVVMSYGGDGDYLPGSVSKPLTVGFEDATFAYTGTTYAVVNSNGQATVVLSAMVYDAPDGKPGDVRNAKVTFSNTGGGTIGNCKDVAVNLVDPSNTGYGTATCQWTANLSSSEISQQVMVHTTVGGYFSNGNTSSATQDTIVTVTKAVPGTITGAVDGIAATSPTSMYSSDFSDKSFAAGFGVSYNKQMTNLQGSVTVRFTTGGRTYIVKSNSLSSLTTTGLGGSATFAAKASVQDSNGNSVEGNATLQLTLKDNTNAPGTIGITISGKSGGVIYSNNWNAVSGKTVAQDVAQRTNVSGAPVITVQ